MKGAQIGATEAGNNWIGYIIDMAPGPIMAVMPNIETARRNSRLRIDPLIEECPSLREKVRPKRSQEASNTVLGKDFPGGTIVMTGANSAAGLRSMPARYLLLDEVDAYPMDVEGEGDPVTLAKARSRTFSRKKVYIVSTPTISGRSRIENSFEFTDQRKYFVPCPHCKEFQDLKWVQVKWPEGKPTEAKYECEHCHKLIDEWQKTQMLSEGKWVATKPENENPKIVGYHLNSLYSPVGWLSWGQAAKDFVEAKDKEEQLRGFINTVLGETWKEKGEAPNWKRLYSMRELYEPNSIPKDVCFLTCGVDVQKDRLELEIVGWARGKRSYSIDYRVIPGDTSADEVWTKLDEVVAETWATQTGVVIPLRLMAVDSGYNTHQVYSWVRKHPSTKVIAIKGHDKMPLAVGQPKSVDITVKGKTIRRGLKAWPVGTSLIKSELYGWLRQDAPIGKEEEPIGHCHFPQYGEEYFLQLTAEELVVRIVKGYKRHEWQKTRDRNEALDCRVYARAAASAIGMDRFKDLHWQKLEDDVGIVIEEKESNSKPEATPQKAEQKTSQPVRKRRQSTFWRD